MDSTHLIQRIQAEMTSSGMSCEVLAEIAGISRVTLWRLLTKQTKAPRKTTALRVAKALGIAAHEAAEVLTGQYEMLPLLDRLPQDDELFAKALRNQLESCPETLRLQAVRAALTAMAGVMHQSGDEQLLQQAHTQLRELDLVRWRLRRQKSPASLSEASAA